jgi:hypothetical protein
MAEQLSKLKQILNLISPSGSIKHLPRGDQRILIMKLCNFFGLNPLTNPFLIVRFADGDEKIYVTRDGCNQLRHKLAIDTYGLRVEFIEEKLVISVISGKNKHGRVSDESGSVSLVGLTDAQKADAVMKSTTKAKRRLTLDLSGLSVLSDVEVADMQNVLSFNAIEDMPEDKSIEVPISNSPVSSTFEYIDKLIQKK